MSDRSVHRIAGTDWWTDGDSWWHRPWWKVAINTILRWLQPGPRKWVVFTETTAQGEPPEVLGYGFGRVEHQP